MCLSSLVVTLLKKCYLALSNGDVLLLDFALCGHAASEADWQWSQNLQEQAHFN